MTYIIAFANWLLTLAGVREAGQEVVTEISAPIPTAAWLEDHL